MAITNRDTLVNALAASINYKIFKASNASLTAGIISSLWRSAGNTTAGAIPTTSAECTDYLPGSFILPSVTTEKLYVGKVSLSLGVAGNIFIMDRLSHMGGLNGTLATAQTVNLDITTPVSQNRCLANGSNVQWYLEWYAATGSTAVTSTITYTNHADVTGRTTTVALAATRPISCMLPILPASGDLGIKSIQTVTLSATTGTSGNFGVTATKQIAEVPIILANTGSIVDYAGLGLPEISADSCIMFSVLTSTTSTGLLIGSIDILKA